MPELTIKNDWHRSEISIRVPGPPYTLTPGQVRRCKLAICGSYVCGCGAGPLGNRGPQPVEWYIQATPAGGLILHPEHQEARR